MDIIIYIIYFILIIGIFLLSKSYIKKKYIEPFSDVLGNEERETENGENELEPKKSSDDYEVVGSVPPPNFQDSIYDFNLRNAKKIWEEIGCNPDSKYAPNIGNKVNLFGKVGWATDEFPFRVKSMVVEANKAEYNYYDWGKYKYNNRNPETEEEKNKAQNEPIDNAIDGANDSETGIVKKKYTKNASHWEFDKKEMNNKIELLKRPEIIKYPMGMRKAKALCYGEDEGGFEPPKRGDRVKIKKSNKYEAPFYSGIAMTKMNYKPNEEDNAKNFQKDGRLTIQPNDEDYTGIDVFWDKKGTATFNASTNEIVNLFSNEKCGMKQLKGDDKTNCTRDSTYGKPPQIEIPDVNDGGLGYKLYGLEKDGGGGQLDWFGYPSLKHTNMTGDPDDSLPINNPWKSRYVKEYKQKIPSLLATYDQNASTNMFLKKDGKFTGKIDPKEVYVIKRCVEDSACEDLRCDTIAQKVKKNYPLTSVCNPDEKNDVLKTQGQYCSKGPNKGGIYTYHNEKGLCIRQDYGGDKENANYPRVFCKEHCSGGCIPFKKLSKGSSYAMVWNKANFKGLRAIVRSGDGVLEAKNLFPDAESTNQVIKSMRIFGKNSVAMLYSDKSAAKPLAFRNKKGSIGDYPNLTQDVTENCLCVKRDGGKNLNDKTCSYLSGLKSRCESTNAWNSDTKQYNGARSCECTQTFKKIEVGTIEKKITRIDPVKNFKHAPNKKKKVYLSTITLSRPRKLKYIIFQNIWAGDQNWGNPTKISVEVEYENGSQKKVHTYDWLKDTGINDSDKQEDIDILWWTIKGTGSADRLKGKPGYSKRYDNDYGKNMLLYEHNKDEWEDPGIWGVSWIVGAVNNVKNWAKEEAIKNMFKHTEGHGLPNEIITLSNNNQKIKKVSLIASRYGSGHQTFFFGFRTVDFIY